MRHLLSNLKASRGLATVVVVNGVGGVRTTWPILPAKMSNPLPWRRSPAEGCLGGVHPVLGFHLYELLLSDWSNKS